LSLKYEKRFSTKFDEVRGPISSSDDLMQLCKMYQAFTTHRSLLLASAHISLAQAVMRVVEAWRMEKCLTQVRCVDRSQIQEEFLEMDF
jgi:hypothetical protein